MINTATVDELPNWDLVDPTRIRADYTFVSFAAAIAFMTEVAIHADKLNHHPEWSNVYNRVTVELTTHDAGGLTQVDIDLARLMNDIFERTST
ncbi:MAG: 4a-hydroxytetrahydrobiopterin dehydratase [Acidimicrobiales bacterium]|nr:4a-hydroxytetrahydrobiopterin dehydratase [Acidimicrobiales bacterium]